MEFEKQDIEMKERMRETEMGAYCVKNNHQLLNFCHSIQFGWCVELKDEQPMKTEILDSLLTGGGLLHFLLHL